MSVPADKFDELLARLAKTKPLPQAPAFRTSENIAGARLSDSVSSAFRNTPTLDDAIREIAAGNRASGGPTSALGYVGKAAMLPLNVIDMPRRAVISTLKEVIDATDGDRKTKASFGDFGRQFSDTSFGFGRIYQRKGWGGRIVGFLGDVALDPLTYMTFGASVPLKATARGGTAALKLLKPGRVLAAEVAEDVALRTLLGTKTVAGREGRFALANVVRKYGGSAEDVAAVAARGKSAVPDDIARAIGLQRSGLYMFGSRVRLPGSGVIGDALERGVVGVRLGAMNTKLGKKLSYLYTPRGSGAVGDLKNWRADLASNRLDTKTTKMIFAALGGAEEARALGSMEYAEELRRVTQLFETNPETAALRDQLHKFIEKPESVVLSGGQPGSRDLIIDHLRQAGERIKVMMNEVEPGWQMPLLDKYVPHILTKKAREEIERNADQPWAQYLQKYLSVDVNDLQNNVSARYIRAGMEDFLGSGETVVDDSIEGINQLFRKVTKNDYDLFETNMEQILRGYAQTVAQVREMTTVMKALKDADFVRVLRETGHVDETYMVALKQMVDDSMEKLTASNEKLANLHKKMADTLYNTTGSKGTVGRLLAEEREALGVVKTLDEKIAEKTVAFEKLEPLLAEAREIHGTAVAVARQLANLTSENSAVVTMLREQTAAMGDKLKAISAGMQFTSVRLRAVNSAEELLKPELLRVEEELASLARTVESNASFINFLRVAGDFLGPEIERVFASFRDELLDVSGRLTRGSVGTVDVAAVADKEINQGMNKVLQAITNPMDTDFLVAPKGRVDAPDVINDAWVRSVVDSEGTPERAVMDMIPDFGARTGKAERVSMGSTRQTARSMNLTEARDAVVRAAVTGDNHQDAADAFAFLTLRELRSSGLNAGDDIVAQRAAQAAFAQELIDNQTPRAKAWNTAVAALKDVEQAQREFTEIVSRKTQLGTVTVGSTQVSVDVALAKVKELSAELVELRASGIGNAVVAKSHREFMDLVDAAIMAGGTSGRGEFLASSKETRELVGAFYKFVNEAEVVYGRILPDTDKVDDFVRSFIGEDDSIDADSLQSLRAYVEGITQKHLIDKDAVARVEKQLADFQASDVLKEATYLSQRANASEFTSAETLRAAGDTLVNYSIFHNARVAIDYVQRLLPASVEVSDSLLKFAFAGSARQHAVKYEAALRAANWVRGHMRQIARESEGVVPSERALWLLERVGHKILPDGSRVPLSETEVAWMQQVIGDLYNFASTDTLARDLPNFRASKQSWRDLVTEVLNITRPGWDELESSATLKTEEAFIRTPKRAKLVTGRGDEIRYGIPENVQEASRAALAADAAGKYSERSVASNRMNIYRMTVEDLRKEIKKIPFEDGGVERKAALLKQLDDLESSIKTEWKEYGLELKKRTGRTPSEAAAYQRSARQNTDAHGIGAYWLEAVRRRSNGATMSPRSVREFFVRLLGDGEITVDLGLGRGFALDETLNLQRRSATGEALFAQNVKEIWAQARRQRKTKIEQMAWIAANNGISQDSKIVKILEEVNSIDEQLRIARLPKDTKLRPKELIAELTERQNALVKEFTDSLTFKLTADAGGMPYDLGAARALGAQKRKITYGESHVGKTMTMLEGKLAPLRELVFNPEAGLNNLESLRFGFDELGGNQLASYRVTYLRGLAEDYRIALVNLEQQKKELKRALPLKKEGEQVTADFDLFAEIYGGDPAKFARVSRWIESVQHAIQNNAEIPARPADVQIPQRLANVISDMRRAAEKLNEVVQKVEFGEAREAEKFKDFLRVLSKVHVSQEHLPEAKKLVVAYNNELQAFLQRSAQTFDPMGLAPTVSVKQSTVVPFERGTTMDAIAGMDESYDVVVRTADGTEELVDKNVASNAVKQVKKEKFQYRVTRESDPTVFGQDVYVFQEVDGTRWTFPVNQQADNFFASQGIPLPVKPKEGEQVVSVAVAGTSPVYSQMTRLGVNSTDVVTNRAARQHDAFFTSQVTVLRHSGEAISPAAARTVLIPDTRAFFNLSGQQRVVVRSFLEMGIQPQTSSYVNPAQIFTDLGITEERIAAAFAREIDPGSKTVTAQLNKVKKLREEKKALEAGYRSLKSRARQQESLTRIEEIDGEMSAILRTIESGGLRERAAGFATVRGLYDYFSEPQVASAILGRVVLKDEAEDLVVKVFEKYVETLHSVQATRTLADGSTEIFNPFVREAGEAATFSDNISKNWSKGPHKEVLGEYERLNKIVINGVAKLNVAKDGGQANHLLQKYVSVLQQLRAAEGQVDVAAKRVEDALFVNPESLVKAQEARAKIPEATAARNAARDAEKAAKARLDRANRIIVSSKDLENSQRALDDVLRVLGNQTADPEDFAVARRSRPVLQQQIERQRAELEALQRYKDKEIAESMQALEDAKAAVSEATNNLRTLRAAQVEKPEVRSTVSIRRGVDKDGKPIVETFEDMSKMSPDVFDDFVEQEIKAIKDGFRTPVTISISQEQLAAKQAQLAGDQARLAELQMVAPELRERVQATLAMKKAAEQRMEGLLDQFNKTSAQLRKMESAAGDAKGLPFGGKGLPAEFVAAKAKQKEIQKKLADAQKQMRKLLDQVQKNAAEVNAARSAGGEVETLKIARDEAEARLNALSDVLAGMGGKKGIPAWVKSINKRDWEAEFDSVQEEVQTIIRALKSLPPDVDRGSADRLASTWTKYLEGRSAMLLSRDEWNYALSLEKMGADGIMNSSNTVWTKIFDDGFVAISGSGSGRGFQNLQMRPEVGEFLSGMGRIRDKGFVLEMRRWMNPYTKFFKAWALATPGFHVRNALTNGFMMVAAGGDLRYLAEGMREYNAMYNFLKTGLFSDYIETIADPVRRRLIEDSYKAMHGSGVGQVEEIAFDEAGKLTNNFVTRWSKKKGTALEQHSRFMLAYDGLKQGYGVDGATARVRRFLFDYEDMSQLDVRMRQIIPFWTWTSRNFPLTVQNVVLNPRPYQIYNSMKRNIQDEEKTSLLPQYMREAGGFALPGGGAAVTPELGFNRLQADLSMLSDPKRFAANVNPLLRIPVETQLADKSFFRDRPFEKAPVPTDGPVGTLAALLGQPLGLSQSVGDQRYVNEKLLYALTNALPMLNTAERFIPTQEYYQQRGNANPLLGFLGSPIRQVTPQMRTSEMNRRYAELQKLLQSQPQPVEE